MTDTTRAERRPRISPGTEFEYQVARLRFHQGFFVRRAIDVWPAGLEGATLAELDCLAVTFDPHLRRVLEVVECKTGARGQGEIDRLIWLRGIDRLIQARAVTFAKLQVAARTRNLARQLDVDVLDEAAIARAEVDLGITADGWLGFHDPDFGERIVKPARAKLNSTRELQGVGKFLFGSFWFVDDFTRIKQLRRAVQLLVRHEELLPSAPLQLGLGEVVTLLTLTVASIAMWQQQMDTSDFRELVTGELTTGLGDARGLRLLLRRIDEYRRDQINALHSAYQGVGAGRLSFPVTSFEVEVLTPAEWIDAFIDLVTRFARRPRLATDVVRWTDLWAARLLGATVSANGQQALFGGQEAQLQDELALVLAFLTRIWGVPADYLALANPAMDNRGENRERQVALGEATDMVGTTETGRAQVLPSDDASSVPSVEQEDGRLVHEPADRSPHPFSNATEAVDALGIVKITDAISQAEPEGTAETAKAKTDDDQPDTTKC
ncbi:MAG TPA: hypothetical protein VLA19_06865 [Herpetosiphonaceae bacterium]|nr:hypothetical protein [Herpetosiphonaceae bacterium]